MNAKLDLGGYILEITSDGYLESSGSCASSNGCVGLQALSYGLSDKPAEAKSIMQVLIKPSQARALASIILSAATEASGRKL